MGKRDSSKFSAVNAVVASICIVIYITAVGIAAIRIFLNVTEYRNLAREECSALEDRAVSAAFMGFMSKPYQETIQAALRDSGTLQGAIISGPRGEYVFERVQGASVAWVGDRPRFKQAFGLSKEPHEAVLRIPGEEGHRVRVVYETVNYPFFVSTLKNSLIMIGAALGLAFLTLLAEALAAKNEPASAPRPAESRPAAPRRAGEAEAPPPYSPRSGVCRESLLPVRLAAELRRSTGAGQDLVLAALAFKDRSLVDEALHRRLASETARFFGFRDRVFEKGAEGVFVIIPGADLDQGLVRLEEFHALALSVLSDSFPGPLDLSGGLSSRSGRMVDPERLIFEAGAALEKALADPASPIIAFRIDPEKYRAFMAARGEYR